MVLRAPSFGKVGHGLETVQVRFPATSDKTWNMDPPLYYFGLRRFDMPTSRFKQGVSGKTKQQFPSPDVRCVLVALSGPSTVQERFLFEETNSLRKAFVLRLLPGHGKELLSFLYGLARSRKSVFEITVEDPAPGFEKVTQLDSAEDSGFRTTFRNEDETVGHCYRGLLARLRHTRPLVLLIVGLCGYPSNAS